VRDWLRAFSGLWQMIAYLAGAFLLTAILASDYVSPKKAWPGWVVLLVMLVVPLVVIALRKNQNVDPLFEYKIAINRWNALLRELDTLEATAKCEFEQWQINQDAHRFDYLKSIASKAGPRIRLVQEIEPAMDVRGKYAVLLKLDRTFAEVHFTVTAP
jgi:hypothetical protein